MPESREQGWASHGVKPEERITKATQMVYSSQPVMRRLIRTYKRMKTRRAPIVKVTKEIEDTVNPRRMSGAEGGTAAILVSLIDGF